jgi:hypothetical protein
MSASTTGTTAIYISMLDNLPGTETAIKEAVKVAYKAASKAIKEIIKNLPMYFVPEMFTPTIYDNTVVWLTENPTWYVLHYHPGRPFAEENRRNTRTNKNLQPADEGYQWDEFPYASTEEGNQNEIKVAQVPQRENSMQGGYLKGFYARNFPGGTARKITGFSFLVIPVPALPNGRPDTTPTLNIN